MQDRKTERGNGPCWANPVRTPRSPEQARELLVQYGGVVLGKRPARREAEVRSETVGAEPSSWFG